MAGLPAGMEDFSDGDDDLMCFNFKDDDNDSLSDKITDKGNLRPLETGRGSFCPSEASQNGSITLTDLKPVNPNVPTRSPPIVGAVVVDDLRMAVLTGNLDKVQQLLCNGLDVDVIMKSNWTCLMYASSCGHSPIVKFLLEKKANPNYQKDMFTPLLAVCASRQDREEELLKCLRILIENGANTDVWDRHHMTPLMFCARENRVGLIQELVLHQVDVNKQDNRGWTALFWAASNGHGQSLRVLLENGADASHVSNNGQTATDVAYTQKYEEIADILSRVQNRSDSKLDDEDKESLLKSRKGQRNAFLEVEKPKFSKYGELEMFLVGLKLTDYISLFHEHKITNFSDALLLTEEDLEKMGVVKVGVRKAILEGIKTVHLKKWEKTSLPDLRKQQYISCPDAVAMMANISNHLNYIKSSVRYLRNQIQKTPRILELGQEAANVHKLLEESRECIRYERILYDELRFFKVYLEKVQDRSEYQPADFIVETVPDEKQKSCKISCVAILGTTLIVGLLVWRKPNYLARLLVIPQKWHGMLT